MDVIELRKTLRRIATITFKYGKSSFEERETSLFIDNHSHILSQIEFVSGLLRHKTWKAYAFSHQTFQEYLMAEDLANSQQGWGELLAHITEPRWREVFFLTIEILTDTDEFLRLFKQGCQALINESEQWWSDESFLDNRHHSNQEQEVSENLDDSDAVLIVGLLSEVNQKLRCLTEVYKASAIRAFYFICSIVISEVYSNTGEFLCFSSSICDFSTDKIIELPCTLDSKLYSAIEPNSKRKQASQIEIDYRLILAFEIASHLTNWCSFGEIGQADLEEVYNLNLKLERKLYFNITLKSIENKEFILSIQQIKNQLPHPGENSEKLIEWWSVQGGKWLEEFKDWIVEHRKIVHHWRFSDSALEAAHRY